MYSINKFVFWRDSIIYLTVFEGDTYNTVFKRNGLTNEEAQVKFRADHFKNVEDMIREKKRKQKSKITLN